MSDENVYEMYVANGNRADFWIKRENWVRTVARVLEVQGKESGELDGYAPYYGDPPVVVDVYDEEDAELKDEETTLSCSGNYTYKRIAVPWWWDQRQPKRTS